MNPIALGYVRVSTGRQDLSVEAQTEAVRRAAEYHQLAEFQLFAEPDTSGSTEFLQREQGARLLSVAQNAIAAGREVTIIVPKVDRLGRDTVDVSQTARLFEKIGARLLLLDINVDTRTPMGRAFMQIAAVFAELELARIRERIQTALDHKRDHGLLTGTVPYGFDAVETGEITAKGVKVRRLMDNPAEQRWILEMARLRYAGWGYHSIAKCLNKQGADTKHGRGDVMKLRSADGESETGFTSGRWQAGNVAKVLNNKTVVNWLAGQPKQQAA
jgi:DNA invertase Pin-like site-specific DNA recombinase